MLEKEMAEAKIIGIIRMTAPGKLQLGLGGELDPKVQFGTHVHVFNVNALETPQPFCLVKKKR